MAGSRCGAHPAARRRRDRQRGDHVLQLAHVARPVIPRQRREHARARASARVPTRAAAARQKCSASSGMSSGRSRSGGTGCAPRRADRTGPARKRPAAASARRSRLAAATSRTSTVRLNVSPTRRTSCCCSTRSSFACARGDSSATSSRNSVPPSASSNRPGAVGDRAGEGAARVAEQLRLEQLVGQRRAVDVAEPALAPRAELVHRPRHQLLADAALPFDQRREWRRCRAADRLAHLGHRRADADELGNGRGHRRGRSRRRQQRLDARCGDSRGQRHQVGRLRRGRRLAGHRATIAASSRGPSRRANTELGFGSPLSGPMVIPASSTRAPRRVGNPEPADERCWRALRRRTRDRCGCVATSAPAASEFQYVQDRLPIVLFPLRDGDGASSPQALWSGSEPARCRPRSEHRREASARWPLEASAVPPAARARDAASCSLASSERPVRRKASTYSSRRTRASRSGVRALRASPSNC